VASRARTRPGARRNLVLEPPGPHVTSVPDLVSDAYPTGCSEHQVCSDELGGLCALGRSPVPCGRHFVSLLGSFLPEVREFITRHTAYNKHDTGWAKGAPFWRLEAGGITSVPDLMSDACPTAVRRPVQRSVRPLNACPPEGPEALQACSLFQGSKAWLEPRLEPAETHPALPRSRSAVLA
jgi:hypothetical protein